MDERPLEPGVEPIRIAEAGQLAPGDHQRLLHRVLGEADVTEDAARDPEQRVPARARQDGEGLPVAALGLLDEIAVHLRPLGGAHRVRRPSLLSQPEAAVFKDHPNVCGDVLGGSGRAAGQSPFRTSSSVASAAAGSTVVRYWMFGVSHPGRVKPDSGPSVSSTTMHAGVNVPIG